ncbi:hypothetical protein C8Q76DRAFT_334588 [Earliella scabrosa]|nr:hypothetical protein C8Q76DRAFT_334588 [Earliella scabrosa]
MPDIDGVLTPLSPWHCGPSPLEPVSPTADVPEALGVGLVAPSRPDGAGVHTDTEHSDSVATTARKRPSECEARGTDMSRSHLDLDRPQDAPRSRQSTRSSSTTSSSSSAAPSHLSSPLFSPPSPPSPAASASPASPASSASSASSSSDDADDADEETHGRTRTKHKHKLRWWQKIHPKRRAKQILAAVRSPPKPSASGRRSVSYSDSNSRVARERTHLQADDSAEMAQMGLQSRSAKSQSLGSRASTSLGLKASKSLGSKGSESLGSRASKGSMASVGSSGSMGEDWPPPTLRGLDARMLPRYI